VKKTNAMRILDAAHIPYRTLAYNYDESDLSGTHAAAVLDLPPERVFKTLVAKGDKTGPVVFCIPVHRELNLKKAASATKNKRIEMLPVKDLLGLTGYVRGGCSPIGMKKKFSTFIDETILLEEEISISAGTRGCQILMAPSALIAFIEGQCCDLTGN